MTNEIKKPQLSDVEKLPRFFQDLYENWILEKDRDLTPGQVTDKIAELKLAYEMAKAAVARKTTIDRAFNALDKCPNIFPSAAFVSPILRVTAYYKAGNYLKSLEPKAVQSKRAMSGNVALTLARCAHRIKQ